MSAVVFTSVTSGLLATTYSPNIVTFSLTPQPPAATFSKRVASYNPFLPPPRSLSVPEVREISLATGLAVDADCVRLLFCWVCVYTDFAIFWSYNVSCNSFSVNKTLKYEIKAMVFVWCSFTRDYFMLLFCLTLVIMTNLISLELEWNTRRICKFDIILVVEMFNL